MIVGVKRHILEPAEPHVHCLFVDDLATTWNCWNELVAVTLTE